MVISARTQVYVLQSFFRVPTLISEQTLSSVAFFWGMRFKLRAGPPINLVFVARKKTGFPLFVSAGSRGQVDTPRKRKS